MGQKVTSTLLCMGLCLLLAACASGPEIVEFHTNGKTLAPKKATSRPYQIKGVWYYPQPYYEYVAEGIASHYGQGDIFHGRRTATGAIFDKNGLTAAHKEVPLPCIAKVTNLENGREVIVEINDRGPFVEGRFLDVSWRTAQLLGFAGRGLARVRVETLVPESLVRNGIDPSTVMVAQANTEAPLVQAPALCSLASPASPEPDTLFEAWTAESSVENVAPEPPIMAHNSSVLPPVEMIETEPVMIVETQPLPPSMENSSPLPVKLEAIPSTGIFVYVGEFDTQAQAQAMSRALGEFADSAVGTVKNNGPKPYAVSLGPLLSMSQANQMLDQLANAGHLLSRIVIQH